MKHRRSAKLVELRNIHVTLGSRLALRDVSWSIGSGEGWLVTGPNGAGKTTLLRLLAGRIWPDSGKRGGERIYYFDRQCSDSPIGLEGRLVWLSPEVHQRFARLEPSPHAGDIVLTGFANTFLLTQQPTVTQRFTARQLAKKLGLEKLWRRPFAELSQGQQRLVLLARALAPRPRLLVLDEFSDGLDEVTRAKIGATIIQRLRAGAAVVVAAHRASDLLPGVTRHLRLEKGQAAEIALPDFQKRPGHWSGDQPSPTSKKSISVETTPLVKFRNASIVVGDHQRTQRIVHHLNWSVLPGEHWAVRGANGSGKSTLLRAIYGELPVARGGSLERFGKDEEALPLPEARARMGWISPALQHHYAADVSVVEVVASGFQSAIGLQRPPTKRERQEAYNTLRRLGMGKLAQRRWGELSFGEARLVLLARALAPRPLLLLLDEPCDGLSPLARKRFLRLVDAAARAGAQVLIAAHRPEDLPGCVNRTLRLHNGRMI